MVVPLSVIRHWNDPGIYLFEVANTRGSEVLYVGETSSFATRLRPGCAKLERAIARGMKDVLVHFGPDDKAGRLRSETQLRGIYDPPFNEQDNPLADALDALYATMAQREGAFGEQPKGLGIGLLDAVGNTPRRR